MGKWVAETVVFLYGFFPNPKHALDYARQGSNFRLGAVVVNVVFSLLGSVFFYIGSASFLLVCALMILLSF